MNRENVNKMNKHYMLWYFFIFSIIGLIMETTFYYVTTGNIESRKGFFISPICPVYGIGAIFIIYISQFVKSGIKEIVVVSALAGAVLEYVLSFMLEAMYGNRFWDYSYLDFNLNGRICLKYTMYWMIAGVVAVKIMKPLMDKLITKFLENKIIDNIIFSFLVIDAVITVWAVNTYTTRAIEKYNNTYVEAKIEDNTNVISKIRFNIENKLFSDKIIVKTFPNIRIRGINGEEIFARDLINF